jgi:hypothetical protein
MRKSATRCQRLPSVRYSRNGTNPKQGSQYDYKLEIGIHRNCRRGSGESSPLTRLGRLLLVAALAVGACCSAPATAQAPLKPFKKQILVERTPQAAQAHAQKMLPVFGWTQNQWSCLKALWTAESNWRPDAFNKTPVYQIRDGKRVKLHAGGIPQKLNLNPKSSVEKQVAEGFKYIKARYSTPCGAWSWHQRRNWY